MECIFCKITAHEIESKIVYEDDKVMAFLDVNPISAGHTLVIPKIHYENIFDISPDTLERIASIAKKLALTYEKALNVKAVNLLNASGKEAQQSIFHFHLHLIPRKANDKLDLWFHGEQNNDTDLDETFKRIKQASADDSK
jgi:histidine triad (HIT) family protein